MVGIVAILGPLGNTPYFYALWALLVTVFSLVLFWGRYRSVLVMFKPTLANIVAALAFIFFAVVFAGTLFKSLDNVAFVLPDRQGPNGGVSLFTFLTYGGNDLGDMWKSLLLPSANIAEFSGRLGMTDYVGLLTFLALPFVLRNFGSREARAFAILAAALFALSRGGLLASLAFYFPGMHLFRHIGFLTVIFKLLLLVLAGYGLEGLVRSFRAGTLFINSNKQTLILAVLAIILYFDLNVGGQPWAEALGAPPPVSSNGAPVVVHSIIYPLLRAGMLLALVCSLWNWRRTQSSVSSSRNLVICALLACVAGDCALFQIDMVALLQPEAKRIEFPAEKPDTAPSRSDQIAPIMRIKYQAWQKAQGSDYQIALSSALQWDPLMPHFRTDWFPSNVLSLLEVLKRGNTNDLKALCVPKFRLVSQAIRVSSDEDALALLSSQTGWDDRVILTDPGNEGSSSANPVPMPPGTTLTLEYFSADSLSVHVLNASTNAIWLVYSDAYDRGWHATVNNKSAPVWKAYAAFKAIRVEPGDNHVRLDYHRPIWSTFLTVLASAAGLAAAVGLGTLAWLTIKEITAG